MSLENSNEFDKRCKIIYLDDKIVVCDKNYGVSSQKSESDNMVDLLESKFNKSVYVTNRLDTTTTGLIVYAFDKESCASINEQIRNSEFAKEYVIVVHGKTNEKGTLSDYLYHNSKLNKSFVVDEAKRNAKYASLEYTTLKTIFHNDEEFSLVKVFLKTGRTHQIRVQFSNIGHPVYGDGKYGAKDNDRIAIRCDKISFCHPCKKTRMHFELHIDNEGIWDYF